ncbi:hypothetical protein D3C73_1096220 [compost metagenome]
MVDRPAALGIEQRIEVRGGFIEQLLGLKSVEAQQPVRLIQPVLPEQRRLGIQGGQQRVLDDRGIGGIENPLQLILFVQAFRKVQNLIIRIRRCADDHLCALSCRCEARSMIVLNEVGAVLGNLILDQTHRLKNGLLALIRS